MKIAEKRGLTIHWVPRWDLSEAHESTKQVWVPRPSSPFTYLVALHEFGHCLDKASAKVHALDGPASEAAAWRWAVNKAKPHLLQQMTSRGWDKVGRAWVTSVIPGWE